MSMNTIEANALARRNRVTARRIVGAVLVFHSLALFSGYLVLDRALHPDRPAADRVAQRSLPSATPPAPVPVRVDSSTAPPSDGLAWVTAAQSRDTAAPWRVDAHGHVHFESKELNR